MADFSGRDCVYQRDLTEGSLVPSPCCHLEISSSFSEDLHPCRSAYTREDEEGVRMDGALRDEDFSIYQFYPPVPCVTSPSLAQVSSLRYPDYLLPQVDPYHYLSPHTPGLCKHTPHTWTHNEAFPYAMYSDEVRASVSSIITEESCDPARHQSDLTHSHQLDMGHSMVVLNHCSPSESQMGPVVLSCGVSGSDPPLYTADHTHSPKHYQTRGEGVPVSQVQGDFHSQHYQSSSLTYNTIHTSSSFTHTAPTYCNIMPRPGVSQFHQRSGADTIERVNSEVQSVGSSAWEKLKKPCNCTKSQCLKLYCDCFANGEVCSSCNCINCFNNMEHEFERYRAIKTCLDRNPDAFRPKIISRKMGDVKNRHTKGCNCKRSGCLKNYCECYEAKIMCSSTCKCVGCRNYDGSPVRDQMWKSPETSRLHNSKSPLSCITEDVVEAVCGCLLAQAEEAEREEHTLPHAERIILEEFGQCLTQILHSIFKSTGVQC